MEESAMYSIIKTHLESLGFLVKAEIDAVDIMAVKDNKTLLIEMKKALTLSLIHQGIQRQKLSDYVYLAIFKPSEKTLQSNTFKEKKVIIKRLGLGLMVVDVKHKQLTFLVDPNIPKIHTDHKKKKALNKEFLLRQTALNEGGITRTKIVTAYRELALMIADCLRDGEASVKTIVATTKQMKATRVLIDNHYGWFVRVKRGVYTLSDEGQKALDDYHEVISILKSDS